MLFAAPASAVVTFDHAYVAAGSTADVIGYHIVAGDLQPDMDFAQDWHFAESSGLQSLSASSSAAAVSATASAFAVSVNGISFASASSGSVSLSGSVSANNSYTPQSGSPEGRAWAFNSGDVYYASPLQLGYYAAYSFTTTTAAQVAFNYQLSLTGILNPEDYPVLAMALAQDPTGENQIAGEQVSANGNGSLNFLISTPGTYTLQIYGVPQYNGVARVDSFGFESNSFNALVDFNITTFAAPVPEPGEWAMLTAGLGLVGRMARRRAKARA